MGSKVRNIKAASAINEMGKASTEGMSQAMVGSLSQMYGLDNAAGYDYLGAKEDIVGKNLVNNGTLRELNKVNMPYQVGLRSLAALQQSNAGQLRTMLSSSTQTRFSDINQTTANAKKQEIVSIKGG